MARLGAQLEPGTLRGQVALARGSKAPNVFAWLDDVRARPDLFVSEAEQSLDVLESMVWGYYTALSVRGIVEQVPEMTGHFSVWVHHRMRRSCSGGWAPAIASHALERSHLDVFSLSEPPGHPVSVGSAFTGGLLSARHGLRVVAPRAAGTARSGRLSVVSNHHLRCVRIPGESICVGPS